MAGERQPRPRLEIVREGPGPEPAIGDLLGPYRLEALVGTGGMGRVFRAFHSKLGRTVAIKLLSREQSLKPGAIERFFREARAANHVHHPNIIEITDIVEGPPAGDSYYIMEWLDGEDLASRLKSMDTLPIPEVLQFGRQIASAMAAVHQAGYVHRDLKPENCFVTQKHGKLVVKIIDFGVAEGRGSSDDAPTVAGTPVYFAPEAAAGRAVDERSDIYSLGVMLYELLCGHPPFFGDTLAEYVMKHMTLRPVPIQSACAAPLPSGLAEIVDRCIAKEPGERFQTMAELEAELGRVQVIAARGRGFYRKPIFLGLAIGGAIVVALGVVLAATGHLGHRARVTTAPPTALKPVAPPAPLPVAPPIVAPPVTPPPQATQPPPPTVTPPKASAPTIAPSHPIEAAPHPRKKIAPRGEALPHELPKLDSLGTDHDEP